MLDGGAEGGAQPVPDDCLVYRLIKRNWVKPAEFGDRDRPTSEAFSDASDGYMSVFLADEMSASGKTVDDLLKTFDIYPYCCWWTAGALVQLRQVIVRQPIEAFPGHGGVRDISGRRSAGTRRKLAMAAKWYITPTEVS
jgi:hypothetical protein